MMLFGSFEVLGAGGKDFMKKIPVRTARSHSRASMRPPIRRRERPSGLSGSIVRTVLDGSGMALRRFNDYLVLLHVAAGLSLLAFCVEDISTGGPSRPMIIPILGGYMSASVVFYTVLKERNPTLLVWANGLIDIIFLVAVQRLAYFSVLDLGPDVTAALVIATVSLAYAAAGQSRLILTMTAIVSVFFGFTLVSPATGYPVLDIRSVSSLGLVVAGGMLGWRIASVVRGKSLSASIRTLERLDSAVTNRRIRRLAPPEHVAD
jgi:hypothetical protein